MLFIALIWLLKLTVCSKYQATNSNKQISKTQQETTTKKQQQKTTTKNNDKANNNSNNKTNKQTKECSNGFQQNLTKVPKEFQARLQSRQPLQQTILHFWRQLEECGWRIAYRSVVGSAARYGSTLVHCPLSTAIRHALLVLLKSDPSWRPDPSQTAIHHWLLWFISLVSDASGVVI